MIDEKKNLDADAISNNKKLETLLDLRLKYKIPLLILLTHSDNYCDEVKKTEKDWEKICKIAFNKNKNDLLSYLNGLIETKFKSDFKMNENDIMHIVLVESEKIDIEEIIKKMKPKTRERYEKANDERKKEMLEDIMDGMNLQENDVKYFLENEIHVLDQKQLIEKIKENIPSQYHNALNKIN